jgi:hypothetical protein
VHLAHHLSLSHQPHQSPKPRGGWPGARKMQPTLTNLQALVGEGSQWKWGKGGEGRRSEQDILNAYSVGLKRFYASTRELCLLSNFLMLCTWFSVCASINKRNERWASYWLRGEPLHGRVLGAAASPTGTVLYVTAKTPAPSSQSTIHNPQSTIHTLALTSWAHAVQAQQQALESQLLASAVRPLLQHSHSPIIHAR